IAAMLAYPLLWALTQAVRMARKALPAALADSIGEAFHENPNGSSGQHHRSPRTGRDLVRWIVATGLPSWGLSWKFSHRRNRCNWRGLRHQRRWLIGDAHWCYTFTDWSAG